MAIDFDRMIRTFANQRWGDLDMMANDQITEFITFLEDHRDDSAPAEEEMEEETGGGEDPPDDDEEEEG